MRGAWPYESSPARPSPSLDSPPPPLGRQPHSLSSQMQAGSRFPPPSPYFASTPAQSISALSAAVAAVGHPSYLSEFASSSWQQQSPQNVASDFSESPLGTPYSENGPVDSGYYVGAAAHPTPTLGYPESSQRTHLPEAAYASIYPRFDGGAPIFTNTAVASASQQGAAGESHVYHFPDLTRHYPGSVLAQADVQAARGGYGGQQEGSLMAYSAPPRTHLSPHTGVQSSLYTVSSRHPFSASSRSLDHYGSSSLPPQPSPVMSPFYSSRPSSFDGRLEEPGSPSVVPPLVFDGDAGEEYDDDSECSLPSASSEAPRAGAPSVQHPGQYGQHRTSVRDEWAGPSYEQAAALDELGSPASQESHFEPQSPSPSSDRDFSLEHHDSDHPPKSHHPKKSKMHQCSICDKWFPRPSGLATHMNSHSGARPFKCPIPSCNKSFAVRSNAKRHLRTHGIYPSCEQSSAPAQFTVGFDAPIISDVPQAGKLPAKLRWVPQSLATRTNVDHLKDVGSDSEDEYPPSCPVLPVPLPAVMPSSPKWNPDDRYHEEERNSYEQVGASPYLTSQWRALPGPAIVSPPPF